jgi:FkbM family methyltransferase
MYINFTEIVERWGQPKGVVHIGAHLLEEREEYLKHNLTNTIWVEANPRTFEQIMLIDRLPTELFFNQCITDKDGEVYNFHITNNGQSSSILELHKHEEYHPHIFVTDNIEVQSKRMDTLISENGIDFQNYDFLNLDIQGAELLAIKSFGDLINNFKYIYTEVNTNYLYKDNALMSEIDEYLKKYNFIRVETIITDAEWGDALYVKEEITSKKLIFDIGGHYGLFTEECKMRWPNSKIVVVEANECLWNNLHSKYEYDHSVVPLHYLASDKTGDYKTFHISNYDQISTASEEWIQTSRFSEHNFDTKVGVVTVNLDTLIKIFGEPNLIKIDVEGYEYEVISGLSKKSGEICFEWAEEQYEKINLTCQKLKELGYNNFGYILGDEYLKRPEIFTSWETSDFHNIVNPNDKQKWGMIWVN